MTKPTATPPITAPPTVLCCAGLDPSAAAGLAADIATSHALQCHPYALASTLTVQNSRHALQAKSVANGLLRAQLKTLTQHPLQAAKIGLIRDARHWHALATQLPANLPLVIDPVIYSSSGFALAKPDRYWWRGFNALAAKATLITPNQNEWALIKDKLSANCAVLTTGKVSNQQLLNQLLHNGQTIEFYSPLLSNPEGTEFRGTGCRLSTAIACFLARGQCLTDAIENAMQFMHASLQHSYALQSQYLPNPNGSAQQ